MILKYHDITGEELTGRVIGTQGLHVMVDVQSKGARRVELVGSMSALDPQEFWRIFESAGGQRPVDENGRAI